MERRRSRERRSGASDASRSSCGARSTPSAPRPPRRGREQTCRAATAANPLRREQRQPKRDEAAKRMADHMRALPARRVQNRGRVQNHAFDRQGPRRGLTAANAAVVEPQTAVPRGQPRDLRAPGIAVHADPLDADHRRAGAFAPASQQAAFPWTKNADRSPRSAGPELRDSADQSVADPHGAESAHCPSHRHTAPCLLEGGVSPEPEETTRCRF